MKTVIAAVSLSTVVAGLLAKQPATTFVSYDIELRFIGIGGHHVGIAAQCTDTVRANGYDVLVGTVTGNETAATGVDVQYLGTLARTTDMDFCGIKETSPGQYDDCAATLIGDGALDVILEAYGEDGRGAWLKADSIRTDASKVTGRCPLAELGDILNAYGLAPSGMKAINHIPAGGGGSPDGQPIDDQFSQPSPTQPNPPGVNGPRLFANSQARLKVGFYPPDPAAGGWSLWVKRKVP